MENLGVVVIGRNEGERLVSCFESIPDYAHVVYVDSGSEDESVQNARERHFDVIELDMSIPFTAARARNSGFYHLRDRFPNIKYVQFVDGDCTFNDKWFEYALEFLKKSEYTLVTGRLQERYPDKSIYNKICSIEWNGPSGEVKSCGGIFMIESQAYQLINGMNPSMIAGEEPEMCIRLRMKGFKLYRLDKQMALHDAAMYQFHQWYKRSKRSGFAYGLGRSIHGKTTFRHNVRETRSIMIWGIIPIIALFCSILFVNPMFLVGFIVIYFLQILRVYKKLKEEMSKWDRLIYSIHCVLSKIPQFHGLLVFISNRIFNRNDVIIEHKRT